MASTLGRQHCPSHLGCAIEPLCSLRGRGRLSRRVSLLQQVGCSAGVADKHGSFATKNLYSSLRLIGLCARDCLCTVVSGNSPNHACQRASILSTRRRLRRPRSRRQSPKQTGACKSRHRREGGYGPGLKHVGRWRARVTTTRPYAGPSSMSWVLFDHLLDLFLVA
jgi:hypothetical protein